QRAGPLHLRVLLGGRLLGDTAADGGECTQYLGVRSALEGRGLPGEVASAGGDVGDLAAGPGEVLAGRLVRLGGLVLEVLEALGADLPGRWSGAGPPGSRR
ncbi:hypothetical protein CLM82_30075, partial [Streptomyces albidoflavus]|uniref:hypothetical protein n=1 Tax=Streptomyces albidoflavus TaxID=1886 RepID=UPI000BDCF58F